jgi:hypothetical protein
VFELHGDVTGIDESLTVERVRVSLLAQLLSKRNGALGRTAKLSNLNGGEHGIAHYEAIAVIATRLGTREFERHVHPKGSTREPHHLAFYRYKSS